MANPATATLQLAAANAAIVAASQTPGGAGNLTLVGGGVVTLDVARRVIITSGGADGSRVFTLFGTNAQGYPIQETITGVTTTAVASLMDYKTVTKVSVDAATAAAITVGTNATGSTRWIKIDHFRASFAVGIQGVVASASPVTWQAEYTLDPYDPAQYETIPGNLPGSFPAPAALVTVASGSTTAGALHSIPCTAVRFTITSGTTLFKGTVVQSGGG